MRVNRNGYVGQRGAILVMLAIGLVMVCSFVALAVDIGLIALAKTEFQNAADAAALAGARSLNGSGDSNLSGATSNALAAAIANPVLNATLASNNLSVQHGAYHYNPSTGTFVASDPSSGAR